MALLWSSRMAPKTLIEPLHTLEDGCDLFVCCLRLLPSVGHCAVEQFLSISHRRGMVRDGLFPN